MKWWQKLTGQTPKMEQQTSFPIQFDLIPGKLSVRVHLNNIQSMEGPVPCWTYITKGLWAHQQKELIFSLRRHPEDKPDDFPDAPLKFFTNVHRFAEQGRLVDVGDFSEMARSDFLGRYRGWLYITPEASQNVDGLDQALAAILLTEDELTAVKKFGPMRVTARLGQAARYYPCPPWSDRKRLGLSFTRSFSESLLTKVPYVWMKGVRVRMENNIILLHLMPEISKSLSEQLDLVPTNTPLALYTSLDPFADGCLVWDAGQSQPSAITLPGSTGTRLSGCFILFAPDQAEDSGRLFEDGFSMVLTNASWAAIRQAITTGKTVSIPANDKGMGFRLEWIKTDYHSPVDSTTYHTEGGWETYLPTTPPNPNDESAVKIKQIILLTAQHDLDMRVKIKPLTTYTKTIEQIVRNHFAAFGQTGNQELLVQSEIWPNGKVELKCASRPGIADEILQGLYSALQAIPAPTVQHDSIKFQIIFAIQ